MELTRCAIVENDTVVNIIVVETLEKAIEIFGEEIIDVTDGTLEIGSVRVNGTWTTPATE